MNNRKDINDRLVDWIINKVKTEYADDISMVLIYGSYLNGTSNDKSDVDCYYIPKTERGYKMTVQFIIEGVGYDIFPMSWEKIAGIAELKETMSPLVGDVKIIYVSSTDDLNRFKSLQERLKTNLSDSDYVKAIAKQRCEEASRLCAWMNISEKPSEVRKLAGNIIMILADAVAIYHHDYFHFGLKKQFENLQNNFKDIPKSIVEDYKNVIQAVNADEVKGYALHMLWDVCEYLGVKFTLPDATLPSQTSNVKTDATGLASLYEEICSTFNKIYVCCERKNYILAFLSAVCLQRDLDDARESGCPEYDLLGDFNYTKLSQLHDITKKVESDFVKFIKEKGGIIKEYESFELFKMAKL